MFRTPSLGVPAPQERSTSLFNSTTLFSTASPCAYPPGEVNLFHRVACLPPNPCPPSGEVNLSCHLHHFVSTRKPNVFCHTHQPINQSISQLINQSQHNNGIITMTNTTKPRNHATTNQRANVASRPANHEKATTSKQSTNPDESCNVSRARQKHAKFAQSIALSQINPTRPNKCGKNIGAAWAFAGLLSKTHTVCSINCTVAQNPAKHFWNGTTTRRVAACSTVWEQ